MYKAVIKNRLNQREFSSVFETQDEAEKWVKNHKHKGKDEQEIVAPTKLSNAIYIEHVEGPFGKAIRQKIPAEYDYTIEEFIDRQPIIKECDRILCKTDWLFVSDYQVPTKHRVYYRDYRNLIRRLRKSGDSVEKFDAWLRRNYPQEFMDGGQSEDIIDRFFYYFNERL